MPPVIFDPDKDAANVRKHGLSLSRAREMDWAGAVISLDERFAYGERRFRAYAMLDGRLHMAAITFRGGAIRVISLRKANRSEIRRYGRP
jgi:uncharacterized DUF497 family protein